MRDTRQIHRRRPMLTARQGRVLGRALKFLKECEGDACTPVRAAVREVRAAESKACTSGCSCGGACSKKREAKRPPVRAVLVESHGAGQTAALLRTSLGKVKKLLDSKRARTADGTLRDDDGEVLDRVPAGSLKSDLQRKRSLRKMMSPDEGEVPPGIVSGDPIMSPTLSEDEDWENLDGAGNCQDYLKDAAGRCPEEDGYDWETVGEYESESAPPGRERQVKKLKNKSEAVRAFESGIGDGMAPSDSDSSPEIVTQEGDDRLRPDSPEVNLRYSVGITQGRACGFCRYYQPGDPSNPAEGGGCSEVMGSIQYSDICNLFEPKAKQESARRAVADFTRHYDD